MDVFFFVGDYMKYDFDIIERGQLVQILKSHKQMMGTLDNLGMFEDLDEEYDHQYTEKIIDHFVEKMQSKSSEVSVEGLSDTGDDDWKN